MRFDMTVDIVDVFGDSERVPVETVKPGDFVFDMTGGRHEVRAVNMYGSKPHLVEIVRVDGWESSHSVGDTITIVRG